MRGQTTLDFAIGVSLFLLVVIGVFTFVPGMLSPFEATAREETAGADRIATQLSTGMLGSYDRPYLLDRTCTVAFFESNPSDDPGGDDGENTDGDGQFADPFGTGDTVTGCNFADVPLNERLGLSDRVNVRVRLSTDLDTGESDSPDNDNDEDPDDGAAANDEVPDVLCQDTNSDAIIEADLPSQTGDRCDVTSGDDDVVFQVGSDSVPSGSVVSARRVVTLEGGFEDGQRDATLVVEVW